MKLTDEQQKILDNSDNNLYISAAPGSGKSTMLSHITSRLLEQENNHVMLVTFTNKAAKSIIEKCATADQDRILGGTFHSLAHKLMKHNSIHWNICDEGKKRLVIKKLFNCKKDKERFTAIYEEICKAKAKWPMETSERVNLFNSELEKYGLVDFDDMIHKFIEICPRENFGIPPITYILVDELQDTSGPQLEMLKVLQTKLNCKMIGVADDDQAIYNWRGARPENVQDFISHFNCPIYNMGFNFRSCTNIVEASKKLIENNVNRIPKTIRPFKSSTGSILERHCLHTFKEIDYVISKCRQFYGSEITILYRNRTYKHHLEFELRKAGLKYCVNDALDIVDRSAIKVMFSTMKLAAKMGDAYDLQIASKAIKGLGAKTVEAMVKKVTKENTMSMVIEDKFMDPKGAKRLSSLLDLCNFYSNEKGGPLDKFAREIEKHFIKSFDYQDDMKQFIIDITQEYKINGEAIIDLCNDLGLDGKEEHNEDGAKIELSTVHGYKGLERDIVIMPWCDSYLEQKPGKVINEEDERRLFYVGTTRAENKLILTYSGKKPKFIEEMKI